MRKILIILLFFVIPLHVYAAPILLSPKDNTEVDTSTPVLTWQSTGAVGYTVRGYDSTGKRVIYIAVNPDSGGSGCADGSGNCSKTYLSKPFADGIAKWQIQANNGEFSDFEYFTVNTETSIVDTQAPILTLHGDNPLSIMQGETFTDPGVTATDNRDGTVTTTGSVDTTTVGSYVLTYNAIDAAGNKATLTRRVNVRNPLPSFGVEVSPVKGNTASLGSTAEFSVVLKRAPSSDVVIPVYSSDEGEGRVAVNNLTFTPDNWFLPQSIQARGRNEHVINGIQDYQIVLGKLDSLDQNYHDLNPGDVPMKDIVLTVLLPTESTTLVAGVLGKIWIPSLYSGNDELTFSFIEKPEGMTIDGGLIEWTPPLSAEGNSYSVKVNVIAKKWSSEVAFTVSVPVTTPLQTKIEGSTLTVIEPGSNLNGLEIKSMDNATNMADIKLVSLQENPTINFPETSTLLSDFFAIRSPLSGDIRFRIPASMLPPGSKLSKLNINLNHIVEHHGDTFWGGVGVPMVIDVSGESVYEIRIQRAFNAKGIFVIDRGDRSPGEDSSDDVKTINQK